MAETVTAALNPIALQFGPFTIHWYGVIIATGVVLALWLAVREGQRQGIAEDSRLRSSVPGSTMSSFSGPTMRSIHQRSLPSGTGELPSMVPSSGAS